MSKPGYTLFLISLIVVCITILFVYIVSALWMYRALIALAMLLFLFASGGLWIAVSARQRLVEQVLRLERVRYKEEIPVEVFQGRNVRYLGEYEEYEDE